MKLEHGKHGIELSCSSLAAWSFCKKAVGRTDTGQIKGKSDKKLCPKLHDKAVMPIRPGVSRKYPASASASFDNKVYSRTGNMKNKRSLLLPIKKSNSRQTALWVEENGEKDGCMKRRSSLFDGQKDRQKQPAAVKNQLF